MAKLQNSSDEQDRVSESVRDAPPTHFTFTIQSFSLLSKNSIERYETGSFQAGGYQWKLCLYPNGNKNKDVKDHISFYLIMAETSSLRPGWEVNVVFRLFLYDQIRDKYLTLEAEDAKATGRRFHGMKMEWGFDQFIAHKTFNEPSNGYLINDECVFGAEVFVCKERSKGKGECLSMIKGASTNKHIWKIENFSKLDKEYIESEAITTGDHIWKVKLYPKGFVEGKGNSLSSFLAFADAKTIPPGRKVYVEFILRLMDQNQGRHLYAKVTNWISALSEPCGWQKCVPFSYMNQPGYLIKDACVFEVEVTVLGLVNVLP